MIFDPIFLAQQLICCKSITPHEAGAIDIIQSHLESLGFTCHRLVFGMGVDNLYARLGTQAPHFCFAGHVDVVPPGEPSFWTHDPFDAQIKDGILYGRGAVDMKGAIACFLSAVSTFLKAPLQGSVSFLITADEEGVALDGTQKVLEWLKNRQESFDHCLVGEPSSQHHVGDLIKIGRRGSLNAEIIFKGTQGHVAHPHLADNPVPRLLKTLQNLYEDIPRHTSAHFNPNNLEITSIDVGNPTVNVIPAEAKVRFNIRFNDLNSSNQLIDWIRQVCDLHGSPCDSFFQVSGEADVCIDQPFIDLVQKASLKITKIQAQCSTAGGTSDARFIRHQAPVLEFGLLSQTMHQINEQVPIQDLKTLTAIYLQILRDYFDPTQGLMCQKPALCL